MDKNLTLQNPKVTVLMPVFNGELYLNAAVRSILNQTFADFELLILNDGSTDNSVRIIESFTDARIRLVHNDANRGLIATLNEGLDLSRGEYIARMDCDDISLPKRLQKQIAFMDSHPEVGVCGTWYKEFRGRFGLVTRCAVDHESIKCGTLFNPVVGHPTVMMRKGLLDKHHLRYDSRYAHAEDYALWSRSLKIFDFANLNEVLMLYRIHPWQVTQSNFAQQMESAGKVRFSLLLELGIEPSVEEFQIHQALCAFARPYITPVDNLPASVRLEKIDHWLCRLKETNDRTLVYPELAFSKLLMERWLAACFFMFVARKTWTCRLACKPKIAKFTGLGWKFVTTFLLKHLSFSLRNHSHSCFGRKQEAYSLLQDVQGQ